MRKLFAMFLILSTALWALSSCNNRKVYDSYCHTHIGGWEKNDTLTFDIPPLRNGGIYTAELGLRINESYPFTGITLIAQFTDSHGTTSTDTLKCKLIDNDGIPQGKGISYYQYKFRIKDMNLPKDDSLRICVRHDMKREILPGISDVGISLTMR